MMLFLLLSLFLQDGSFEGQDLMSMSLEELLEINVSTASKKEEAAWEATAVITVVSAREIELFGADNLFEVLDRIPGLQSQHSPGVNRMAIRGGSAAASVNHVLFLVDGRPLRTSGGNLSIYAALHAFPLSMIEQIEVVRGPGSVLYGTNAMEGVVNIITRSDTDNLRSVQLKGGGENMKGYEVEVREKLGSWNLNAGVFYHDTEGWDYIMPLGNGDYDVKPKFDHSRSTRLSLSNENWNFSVFGANVKEFGYASFLPTLSYHSDVWMADLGYEKQLNDHWSVEAHATLNTEIFNWMIDPDLELLPFDTRDSLLETTLFGKIGEKTEVTFGAVAHDVRAINEAGLAGTYFLYEGRAYSAYGQVRIKNNRWDLLVGAQYNRIVDFDSDLVPRLSANYRINDQMSMAVFYGGAFRSPLGLELNINTPGIQGGNPDLKSEHVKTLEGRFFYHKDNTQVTVTAFQSTQEDLIQLVPTPEYSIGVHFNIGEIETKGLEIETRLVKDAWYLTGSYTTQSVEDQDGTKGVTHAPKYHLKFGAGYTKEKFRSGLFVHASDAFQHTSPDDGWFINGNPESEAFQLVSLNLAYDFKLGQRAKATWEVYGSNLLDEEVYNQDFLYNTYNSMPGWAPQAVNTSVKVVF